MAVKEVENERINSSVDFVAIVEDYFQQEIAANSPGLACWLRLALKERSHSGEKLTAEFVEELMQMGKSPDPYFD